LPLQATDDDVNCKDLTCHYKKTVYVTYTDDSKEWVINVLKPFPMDLNVDVVTICDAIPGKTILSARTDFINKATKIILVISKQSITDKIFLFDINKALHKNPDPTEITIIPILYGNVVCSDAPEQVADLISISYDDPEFAAKITNSVYL